MSTVNTSSDRLPKRRVQLLMPEALVPALDEWARRELLDRSAMINRLVLEGMPADLRAQVEEAVLTRD